MAIADIMQSRILQFDPDRRRVSAPHIDVLLADISRGVEELKNRNQELEGKNTELQNALARANERIAHLMQMSAPADEGTISNYQQPTANGNGSHYREARANGNGNHYQEATANGIGSYYQEPRANGNGSHAWNGNYSTGIERGRRTDPEPAINTVELVASKISTFVALNGFYDEVRALSGVMDAEPKGFEKGVLRLLVRYRDNRPLAGKLVELAAFPLKFVSIEQHRIEVELL